MKTALLIWLTLFRVLGVAFADDKPQYKSNVDYIKKTGKLCGICEVRLNTNATVTLVDAKTSGYGYGLTLFSSEGKLVDQVDLGMSQSCTLSDGQHGSLKYELKSVKAGVIITLAVTDHFDARSFGGGAWEQKASVSINAYKDAAESRTAGLESALAILTKKTTALSPSGWSAARTNSAIVLRRIAPVRMVNLINAPPTKEGESDDAYQFAHSYMDHCSIRLRLGEPRSLPQLAEMRRQNATVQEKLAGLEKKMGRISHKFDQYLPSTPQEKKLVAEYAATKATYCEVPEYHFEDFAAYVTVEPPDLYGFYSLKDSEECKSVRVAVLSNLQPYYSVRVESLRTNLFPVVGTLYVIAGSDLYQHPAGSPGPASSLLSSAWSIANEFVFRTALRSEYKLPAGGSELFANNDAMVTFMPQKGNKELTVLVRRRNRAVEIITR
jgi:hypothetical protein